MNERLERIFSFVKSHESRGVIPLSALQDQINGLQYDAVVKEFKAVDVVQSKSSIDASQFTFDVFRRTVMSTLIIPAVKFWFDELAGADNCLDADDVLTLLKSVQRDPRANEVLDALPTQATAIAFIERYATPTSPNGKMNLDGFVKCVNCFFFFLHVSRVCRGEVELCCLRESFCR
jgi:hypothetical protein